MRVIALPSIYEQEHERADNPVRRTLILRIALAVGLGVCAELAVIFRTELLLCAVYAVGWLTTIGIIALVTSTRPISQGESGEKSALHGLTSLPDSYSAVTNCKIPGYEQIGDLDIVVIGPSGVCVIEVKKFFQAIIVNGDSWIASSRRGLPRPMRSVSGQLDNQVRALNKSLGNAGLGAKVTGIIALNPNAPVQVVNPPSYPIVIYDHLAEGILSDKQSGAGNGLTESKIDAIAKHLSKGSG